MSKKLHIESKVFWILINANPLLVLDMAKARGDRIIL